MFSHQIKFSAHNRGKEEERREEERGQINITKERLKTKKKLLSLSAKRELNRKIREIQI